MKEHIHINAHTHKNCPGNCHLIVLSLEFPSIWRLPPPAHTHVLLWNMHQIWNMYQCLKIKSLIASQGLPGKHKNQIFIYRQDLWEHAGLNGLASRLCDARYFCSRIVEQSCFNLHCECNIRTTSEKPKLITCSLTISSKNCGVWIKHPSHHSPH